MQRYFVSPEQMMGNQIRFQGDDLHHIAKVMRSNPGDQVIVSDGTGRDFLARLSIVSKDEVIAEVIDEIRESRELPVHITLAQGLAKGEKMDLIVQKATELGVTEIIPFTSSRTIVKLDDKKEKNRITRWRKIAKEAAEQSHRSRIPDISDVVTFNELIQYGRGMDLTLIAYERENQGRFPKYLEDLSSGSKILLVIGPEGGFSEEEIALAVQNRFFSVTLGKRILRTETAGIVALAYCTYHFELNK